VRRREVRPPRRLVHGREGRPDPLGLGRGEAGGEGRA
jgi:hypothetical protein